MLLVEVLSKPLGIPSDFGMALGLVAMALFIWAILISLKAKAAEQIPVTPASQKQKKFWILIIAYGITCIAMPFIIPLTGVSLPFRELVIFSAITFFICIGITYFTMRLQK